MALLCAGVWAQQPSRPGMGQRNPLQQRQELRQQATPRAGEEEKLEVYFDVKLADFMSPEYINIQVVNCWEPIEYDEASGLFKANVSLYDYQTGDLSYWAFLAGGRKRFALVGSLLLFYVGAGLRGVCPDCVPFFCQKARARPKPPGAAFTFSSSWARGRP